MIFTFFAKQLEQLVKEKGCCHHGWPGIMAEAFMFKDLRPATDHIKTVNKRDLVTACPHTQRSGNAAKSGTDHQCLLAIFFWGIRHSIRQPGLFSSMFHRLRTNLSQQVLDRHHNRL